MVILRKPRARSAFDGTIIGVQDTGTRSSDGAGLRQVTVNSPLQAATLDTAYFDDHPLFDFPDWTDASGNVFCEIPIAYWWRGNLPDTSDGTTPRWTMLMSTEPGTVNIDGTACEFTASPGAFKRAGAWMDKFYFGKYRGYNTGSSKVGSKSGETHWGNVTWTNFKTYCENNGTGYHMVSLQEWHELLARSVIEKATFQIMPEATRATQASCKYRGINDFVFGGSVDLEYLEGCYLDANSKIQLWDECGGSYTNTDVSTVIDNYIHSLQSGNSFNHIFLAASVGQESSCMMPDIPYGDYANAHPAVYFNSSAAGAGAFSVYFYTAAHVQFGTRLCKW